GVAASHQRLQPRRVRQPDRRDDPFLEMEGLEQASPDARRGRGRNRYLRGLRKDRRTQQKRCDDTWCSHWSPQSAIPPPSPSPSGSVAYVRISVRFRNRLFGFNTSAAVATSAVGTTPRGAPAWTRRSGRSEEHTSE